jgi:hypothetical protein
MAAFLRDGWGSESSKHNVLIRRHHTRPDSRFRRPQSEQRPSRCAPPVHQQWPSIPMPLSMTILDHSTHPSNTPTDFTQGITMERTPSGNSILSDTLYEPQPDYTFSDEQAARRVERHFRRLKSQKSQKHERILRDLVQRDEPLDDNEVDQYLLSILTAADSVFFGGVLSGRVKWEWSSQSRYHAELIGTTALRRCPDREGIETLIVLSAPILRSEIYNHRLLLSAFLHELVHAYLFIMCGFNARSQGGHTDGFERIVTAIDNWVPKGQGYLRLCNFKADLDYFLKDQYRPAPMFRQLSQGFCRSDWRIRHNHDGCQQSPHPKSELIEVVADRYTYV